MMAASGIVTVFVEGEYAKSERRFDKGITIGKLKVPFVSNDDCPCSPIKTRPDGPNSIFVGTHGTVDGRASCYYEAVGL